MDIVYRCKACSCRFQRIASCRAEIIASMRWRGQERNIPNLGSKVVLIEIIIWDAVLIWLNGDVSQDGESSDVTTYQKFA